MLHALNGRKARFAAFRGAGLRLPLEDVVTSSIFGPLDFMREDDRAEALTKLLSELGLSVPPLSGSIRLLFWPKLPVGDVSLRSRYTEPDLVLADGRGPRVILEVKWGAPLGEHELAAQWSSVPALMRADALHLMIVRQPSEYQADIASDKALLGRSGCAPWRFEMRSWREVARAAKLVASSKVAPATQAWCGAVANLLGREERCAIHGWNSLALHRVPAADWRYRRPWFDHLLAVNYLQGWWLS